MLRYPDERVRRRQSYRTQQRRCISVAKPRCQSHVVRRIRISRCGVSMPWSGANRGATVGLVLAWMAEPSWPVRAERAWSTHRARAGVASLDKKSLDGEYCRINLGRSFFGWRRWGSVRGSGPGARCDSHISSTGPSRTLGWCASRVARRRRNWLPDTRGETFVQWGVGPTVGPTHRVSTLGGGHRISANYVDHLRVGVVAGCSCGIQRQHRARSSIGCFLLAWKSPTNMVGTVVAAIDRDCPMDRKYAGAAQRFVWLDSRWLSGSGTECSHTFPCWSWIAKRDDG